MIVYLATPVPTVNVPAEKYHIVNYDGVCDKLKISGVQQYDFHIDIMPNKTTPTYLTKTNITDQMKKTFDAWTTSENWQDAMKQLASDLNGLLEKQTSTYVRVRAHLYYDVVKEDYIEFEHVVTNKTTDGMTWVALSNL
jgi:L-rhamnose mutarotase